MSGKIKKMIFDLIFPIFCVGGCGKEGIWLCKECEISLPPTTGQFCPICRKGTINGTVCEGCREKSYISGLMSLGFYYNPTLRELITSLKYYNAKEIIPHVEKFILKFFNKHAFSFEGCLVVPVPLHRKRQWLRGFNQAEIIARVIAEYFNLELRDSIVKRKYDTGEQTKISEKERLTNVVDVFVCPKNINLQGRNLILVDDVYTTGTTMQECAKVLLKSGARSVKGVVLAR